MVLIKEETDTARDRDRGEREGGREGGMERRDRQYSGGPVLMHISNAL
jgi:hypothetical protein